MSTSTLPKRRWATIAHASQIYNRDRGTFRNWIGQGIFPAYRLPGVRGVVVDLDEVEEGTRQAGIHLRGSYGSFGPKAVIHDLRHVAGQEFHVEQAEADR